MKIAVVHVASFGPYSLNPIVDPASGLDRPVTVAVSCQ